MWPLQNFYILFPESEFYLMACVDRYIIADNISLVIAYKPISILPELSATSERWSGGVFRYELTFSERNASVP